MLEQILKEVQGRNAKTVGLQVPEGLKGKALEWALELEKNGIKVFILAEPCYGACDLRDCEAGELGCEMVVHVGHSSMGIKTKVPTVYVEYPSKLDVTNVVEQAAKEISEKKIGVTTTIQHIRELGKVKSILEKKGKEVAIGKPGDRAKYEGQILGCDFGAALNSKDVDAYLHVSTGNFHPIGIALATGKKVYVADPELNRVRVIEEEKEKFLRKRFAKIENSKEAKKFGIIISTKPGQKQQELAEKLKKLCEEKGKEACLLGMNHISADKLLGYGFDAYVSTACPRISIDDADNYDKPMLTPVELEIVLSVREWDDYKVSF